MFHNCQSLQAINELLNWNVSNGIYFSSMFASCKLLQDLNGSQNWNVSNGVDFSGMFYHCNALEEILLSNTLEILTKDMFYQCNPKLKIHWNGHTYTYADLLEYEKIY